MLISTVVFDWTVRVTDLVMIAALIIGPIIAVQLTEFLRKSEDAKKRKIHIFRTLMATRSTNLSYNHIESLNLVEIEFSSKSPSEKKVLDAWRLYIAHLNNLQYPAESWDARRKELLIDLLYEISSSLGYRHGKSEIQSSTYHPQAYVTMETENAETRKLWLEILRGTRQIPMKAEVFTNQPPQNPVK